MPLVIGRGWATVDLDRARVELADAVAPDATFAEVARSATLGARCVRARAADPRGFDAAWVVLMEPDKEGRIAAFLARHGEGWAADWVEAEGGAPRWGVIGAGPFGQEGLASGTPRWGPFRLYVPAATIER